MYKDYIYDNFIAGRFRHWFFLLTLILLVLILFFSVAFLGKVPDNDYLALMTGSTLGYRGPDETWNPHLYSGMPWFLNPEVFEPDFITTLNHVFEKIIDWRVFFLLLAGVGMYILLVFLNWESSAAWLSALLFTLSGSLLNMLILKQDNLFQALCCLPLLALLVHYLRIRRSLLGLSLLSLVITIIMKQAEMTLNYILGALIIIYWLISSLILLKRNEIKITLNFTLLLIAALGLSFMANAIIYLPLGEFYHKAVSTPDIIEYSSLFYFLLHTIFTLFFSFILDQAFKEDSRLRDLLAICLKYILIFLTPALVAFFLLDTFLLNISTTFLPFLTAGIILLFSLVTYLLVNQQIHRTIYLFLCLLLLLGFFLYDNHHFFADLSTERELSVQPGRSLSDDFFAADDEIFRIFPLGNQFHNNDWAYHNQTIGGLYRSRLSRYSDVIKHCLTAEIQNRVPINWNIVNMLNVKYLIHDDKLPLENLQYAFYDLRQDLTIYSNTEYLPRCWFVGETVLIREKRNIWKKLNDPDFDPSQAAILENPIRELGTPLQFTASLIKYGNDHLLYELETDTLSLLVTSEIYYDGGWEAYLDGTPVRIHPINYILRGFAIPAGKHTLELRFETPRRALLLKLMIISIIIMLLILPVGIFLYLKKNYRGEIVYHLRS